MPPTSNTQLLHDQHAERVRGISASVRQRPRGVKLSIRKATPGHQVHNSTWKDSCHRIDVSALTNILGFTDGVERGGAASKLAVCEGQVTMGQLVKAALAIGFVPNVVPEYPDFTVAGLINGEGIQSSAFRFGVFTHSVVEMEVVLGNGDVVVASTSENADLFANMMESYGTLGIVTRATVALRPALPYVRTQYSLYRTVGEFSAAMDDAVRAQRGDFLEGVVFAADVYVMVHSFFVSTPDGLPLFDPHPYDTEKGDRYYYQYIQQVVLGGQTTLGKSLVVPRDVIPTESFVFRSSRGLYWMMETYVGWPLLTNQPWFRRICDRKLVEVMAKKGFESSGYLTPEESQRSVVQQDMGIKLSRLREGIEYVQKNLGVYPLWCCPVSVRRALTYTEAYLKQHPEASKSLGDDYLVDIGVYGEPTVQPFYHRRAVKALQEFVDSPSKWGVCYKDKEELRKEWLPIRTKYHAVDAFLGIEDKTTFRGGDDDNLDELPIPNWRLVDQHGWYWWIKLPCVAAAAVALLALILWFAVWSGRRLLTAVLSA